MMFINDCHDNRIETTDQNLNLDEKVLKSRKVAETEWYLTKERIQGPRAKEFKLMEEIPLERDEDTLRSRRIRESMKEALIENAERI